MVSDEGVGGESTHSISGHDGWTSGRLMVFGINKITALCGYSWTVEGLCIVLLLLSCIAWLFSIRGYVLF
jgi:hypothetical protein